jgi:ankyrin repeat protein
VHPPSGPCPLPRVIGSRAWTSELELHASQLAAMSPRQQLRAVMREWAHCAEGIPSWAPEDAAQAVKEQGWTALMAAAHWGNAEWLERLLAHKPEQQVLEADKHGQIALLMAAAEGHTLCLGPLLAHVLQQQVLAARKA